MEAINIILDEDGMREIFIEIETDNGRSIDIGKRSPYGNGLTKIRITAEDIKEIE